MGFRFLVTRAREVVRQYKMITIAELAYILDRSPTYTKYSIAPALAELDKKCIEYNERSAVLRWLCDGDSGEG